MTSKDDAAAAPTAAGEPHGSPLPSGPAGVTTVGGLRLPPVGFGTYKLTGEHGAQVITDALRLGYRLLDSAFSYENEGAVGAAVRRSGVPREEIVVTSKLAGRHHQQPLARAAIEESVMRTGLDRIDLFLIHWPNPRRGYFVEAWDALIDARDRGIVGHIGVCNFTEDHIETLLDKSGVCPEVNQVEMHPYFAQTALLDYHRRRRIVTQAWGPLGRGRGLLLDSVLQAIAESHAVSPAQVILAWHHARGVVPIPKATSPQRQQENLALCHVSLSPAELEDLDSLSRAGGRTGGQDPDQYEEL